MAKTRTGGTFDPAEEPVYFLAGNLNNITVGAPFHDYLLIAVNEIKGDRDEEIIAQLIGSGKKVFIDSGIFFLTNEHARAHGVSMDRALGLAPEEIDGFGALWTRYLRLVQKLGAESWGYIELDQGGVENKRRTRAKLEQLGLRPIPVYHPLNDGWDYFDELAQNYDRICFGNVVQADAPTRKRLIATAWERHRDYPDLWIHLLGYTPNELLYALPINSGDSSSWLSMLRWAQGYSERAAGAPLGGVLRDLRYKLGESESERGTHKAVQMSAYGSTLLQRNWRTHLARMRELGAELYPERESE